MFRFKCVITDRYYNFTSTKHAVRPFQLSSMTNTFLNQIRAIMIESTSPARGTRISKVYNTSKSTRRIVVNTLNERFVTYPANEVKTSKYALLTFLPKNLYEQFHGIANFYFVGIVILQAFPQFSQVSIIIPTIPIVIILLATAVKVPLYFYTKDGVEDLKRHNADDVVNKSPVYLLGTWENNNYFHRETFKISDLVANLFNIQSKDSKIHPDKLRADDYILKTAETNSAPGVSPDGEGGKLENSKDATSSTEWQFGYWKDLRGKK